MMDRCCWARDVCVENDDGQQPGTASGRLRDDGQRNVDLLRQNGNSDDQPHDRGSELHLWYAPATGI